VTGAVVEDGRELEIDDAKPPVRDAVGDVPQFAIFMADSKVFEFGEKRGLPLRLQLINAPTAVGGDDFEIIRLHFEQSGDEIASTLFEIPQDADFVFEAFARLMAAKRLVDPAIEADPDNRPRGIFHFMHERPASAGAQMLASVALRAAGSAFAAPIEKQ
jgi:hypothetical protein